MKLHARAAGVGKDRVHTLALECANEYFAAELARPDLALPFIHCFRVCFCSLAHFKTGLSKKNPRPVGRGRLGNFNLSATNPTPVEYQYDQFHYDCCHYFRHNEPTCSPSASKVQAGKVPNSSQPAMPSPHSSAAASSVSSACSSSAAASSAGSPLIRARIFWASSGLSCSACREASLP